MVGSTLNQKLTKFERSLTGEDDKLALLIPIRQNLQTIRHDGEKLDIVPLEQGHHLLESAGQPHRHLGALLVVGLEKPGFFFKKNSPVGFLVFWGFFLVLFGLFRVFPVFWFFYIFAQKREFLGFFSVS